VTPVTGGALRRIAERAARLPRPPAVVVNVGWVNGVAAIRSLGRAGVPVVALDRSPSALGLRSRYATGLVCPDPVRDEARFVELLVRVGDALGRPAPILPTHDEELKVIARNAATLGDRFLYPFPAPLIEQIQRKRFQLEQAHIAGVPIPETAYPQSSAEALVHAADIGYPLLVKPSEPDGFKRLHRRPAFRCNTPAELEQAYAQSEAYAPMIQELIPGGDDELYTLGSYLSRSGEALGLFCGRKLRQTPPHVGTCRVGEALWVDEVVDLGQRLLRQIGFSGISQVEFKRDHRDGRYRLMEVNPRLWQWHSLAAACGVDLPVIAYRDLIGERQEPIRGHASGRRWAISLMSGEKAALQRPPYVDALLAFDDPRPALVQISRVARAAFR
jgi:predicted ATP-grasp superfamily ATP-dependent carboligase